MDGFALGSPPGPLVALRLLVFRLSSNGSTLWYLIGLNQLEKVGGRGRRKGCPANYCDPVPVSFSIGQWPTESGKLK